MKRTFVAIAGLLALVSLVTVWSFHPAKTQQPRCEPTKTILYTLIDGAQKAFNKAPAVEVFVNDRASQFTTLFLHTIPDHLEESDKIPLLQADQVYAVTVTESPMGFLVFAKEGCTTAVLVVNQRFLNMLSDAFKQRVPINN